MAVTIGGVKIDPNGQTLVVDVTTDGGARPTVYTAAGGSSTHSLPVTISTASEFHIVAPTTLVVSVKRNGVEIAGQGGVTRSFDIQPGTVASMAPSVEPGLEAVAQETKLVHLAGSETVTGDKTFSGVTNIAELVKLRLGAGDAVTIVSGVATVTSSYVRLDAEGAGTTDQLDTITMAGATDGDALLLTVNATDTITVDDANINLAAATRAIAPGGSLLLLFDGTEWTELHFTAATDNV